MAGIWGTGAYFIWNLDSPLPLSFSHKTLKMEENDMGREGTLLAMWFVHGRAFVFNHHGEVLLSHPSETITVIVQSVHAY